MSGGYRVVGVAEDWGPTHRNVCEFIVLYTRLAGYPPSVRDIAAATGMSLAVAHARVSALVRAGVLERATSRARALRVVGSP